MAIMRYMLQAYYACLCYTGMFCLDCPDLAEDGRSMKQRTKEILVMYFAGAVFVVCIIYILIIVAIIFGIRVAGL